MNTTHLTLIKGMYTPDTAAENLSEKIQRELNFQRLQNYISQIRYEEDCCQAKANIKELEAAAQQLEQLIHQAKENDCELVIESVVNISFVKNPAYLANQQVVVA